MNVSHQNFSCKANFHKQFALLFLYTGSKACPVITSNVRGDLWCSKILYLVWTFDPLTLLVTLDHAWRHSELHLTPLFRNHFKSAFQTLEGWLLLFTVLACANQSRLNYFDSFPSAVVIFITPWTILNCLTFLTLTFLTARYSKFTKSDEATGSRINMEGS